MSQQNFLDQLSTSKPWIMGILNVTPDSFSDGGLFTDIKTAQQQSASMISDGAQIIDVGGESTRPGAAEISVDQELQRVIPVIEAIRQVDANVLISIDTSKAHVMRQAVLAGANMINDVNALQAPGAMEVAVELQVPVCLMHKQGMPTTMQTNPRYDNVVNEVYQFLSQRVQACELAGLNRALLMVDPGFGFGKNLEHNMALLANLDQFKQLKLPLLVGLSRKSMFEKLLGLPVQSRLIPSVAAAVIAAMKGADIIRVHDVLAHHQAMSVYRHSCGNLGE